MTGARYTPWFSKGTLVYSLEDPEPIVRVNPCGWMSPADDERIARLIAAAPKLLNLLQRIHANVDFRRGAGKDPEAKDTAQALLIETVDIFNEFGWAKALASQE